MKRKIIAKEQYTTYANYPLVAGDVRAYEICLDLGLDVSGAEFKVTALRSDGKVVEDIGSVEKGIATYTMASNMYSVPGELTVRLAVLHESSVLTDREIVFKVLEGAEGTDKGENVVPLNDSVILRLGNLEQKLTGKVDKQDGKGLSSNDFTDEYKEKLDSMDETIGEEIERISEEVDNLFDEFEGHKESKDNPHGVTSEDVDTYTKTTIDEKLKQKADKSDITNVYKFKGSVNNSDELPCEYAFEICGDAKDEKGNVIGTFNETTGEIEFDYSVAVTYDDDEKEIIIPVKSVKLPAGYYANGQIDLGSISLSCEDEKMKTDFYIGEIDCNPMGYQYDTTITEIRIVCYNMEGVFSISGKSKIGACVSKVVYQGWGYADYQPVEAGDVYNVTENDVNFAWTGEKWDSLGGEHKDLEARGEIEELRGMVQEVDGRSFDNMQAIENINTQMGDVETALDSIIEIQNSLIGGDSV